LRAEKRKQNMVEQRVPTCEMYKRDKHLGGRKGNTVDHTLVHADTVPKTTPLGLSVPDVLVVVLVPKLQK
jgi:hypothetical protein